VNHVSEWLSAGVSPPLDDYARTLPLADLPDFLATLAKSTAIATLRLHTPTVAAVEPEEWITAADVAALLKIEPKAVRRMAALRPYRSTALGPKTIRYSRAGVMRLIKRRTS